MLLMDSHCEWVCKSLPPQTVLENENRVAETKCILLQFEMKTGEVAIIDRFRGSSPLFLAGTSTGGGGGVRGVR